MDRTPTKESYGDRYIPRLDSNTHVRMDTVFHTPPRRPRTTSTTDNASGVSVPSNGMFDDAYEQLLRSEVSPSTGSQAVLVFSPERRQSTHTSPLPTREGIAHSPSRPCRRRKIPTSAWKILDAPALVDDFYLDVLDWSATNVVSVGLGSDVYLWNARSGRVAKLVSFPLGVPVCCVRWDPSGRLLAVSDGRGRLQVWDVEKSAIVWEVADGHKARIGVMSWSPSGRLLATGSRDRMICLRDARSSSHSVVREYRGHRQEVCGLQWSPDGRYIASGGNDNKMFIWQQQSEREVWKTSEHTAAVKALAWSPQHHGILVSGGGSADRSLRLWDVSRSRGEDGILRPVRTIDTGSQVCQLHWSRNVDEVVSTHGYSRNHIVVWKVNGGRSGRVQMFDNDTTTVANDTWNLTPITTMTGHTMRVLYLSVSPDGRTLCTGAGDETLRFWEVFPEQQSHPRPSPSRNILVSPVTEIR